MHGTNWNKSKKTAISIQLTLLRPTDLNIHRCNVGDILQTRRFCRTPIHKRRCRREIVSLVGEKVRLCRLLKRQVDAALELRFLRWCVSSCCGRLWRCRGRRRCNRCGPGTGCGDWLSSRSRTLGVTNVGWVVVATGRVLVGGKRRSWWCWDQDWVVGESTDKVEWWSF